MHLSGGAWWTLECACVVGFELWILVSGPLLLHDLYPISAVHVQHTIIHVPNVLLALRSTSPLHCYFDLPRDYTFGYLSGRFIHSHPGLLRAWVYKSESCLVIALHMTLPLSCKFLSFLEGLCVWPYLSVTIVECFCLIVLSTRSTWTTAVVYLFGSHIFRPLFSGWRWTLYIVMVENDWFTMLY